MKDNRIELNGPQADMHTLKEKQISDKVRIEIGSAITMVENRVKGAILTALEVLFSPRVELVMKSVNESSRRDADGVLLDPDRKDFSGKVKGFLTTASSRFVSNTDLEGIDETRDNLARRG